MPNARRASASRRPSRTSRRKQSVPDDGSIRARRSTQIRRRALHEATPIPKPATHLSQFSDLLFETRIAAASIRDFLAGGRLRLGVTGLSRSGKTVFITSLVHHLTRAAAVAAARTGRKTVLPVF